ncbi:B-box zinc finger protein 21-like isoform X2 [Carex rostrata]
MKLLCDFCSVEAASLFCFADEAALCNSCDYKIHQANKVASKHCRFSFLHPSSDDQAASSHQQAPLCDICQKKRGFIFCKEDRAILCRECDLSIHTTSDLTRQHTRYLLTGVQLSSVPISSTPTIVEEEEEVGDGSLYNVYNRDDAGASVSVLTETDSNVNTNNTQYFINAKYGWHVEEIMFNNAATTSTPAINIDPMFISSSQYYQGEVNHHASHEGFPFWISQRQFFY